MTFPELYPPRQRTVNVELIRGVMSAADREAFDAADARIAQALHPSLFAELDWMEMTVPESQRAGARRIVDGIFGHHLPAIVAERRVEFDLPDADLRAEVADHWRFYEFLVNQAPEALAGLGSPLSERIQRCLAESPRDVQYREAAAARAYARESPRISEIFSRVEDRRWLVLMVDIEIKNALALTLDHVSSRLDAKRFLREEGGRFPSMQMPAVESPEDLAELGRRLHDLGERALASAEFRLWAVCRAMVDVIDHLDLAALDRFCGERAAGYGGCGRCSMMYASSAILSLDPTCPQLFDVKTDRIFLPLDFNVGTCPFCGEESRAEVAGMFYSATRRQVIYNLPTLGQLTHEQALAQHRPVIAHLRDGYLARASAEEAEAFQHASEEFTYSAADFLLAIQMGTTVKEEHVYNVVRLFDGRGMLVDPTKGVMIELTRSEMSRQWGRAAGMAPKPDQIDEEGRPRSGSGAGMSEAMAAYGAKDYARARQILEKLHDEHPGDTVVRKNLAVIYVTLGDRESARRVLDAG